METTKIRNSAAEYVVTAGLVVTLLAFFLAWRTFVAHDDGVLKLLGHLF